METTITTIDGEKDTERLCVILCHNSDDGSTIELRQQSWGEGLGWYTQNTVTLAPDQLGQLRNSLGVGSTARTIIPSQKKEGFVPRIFHADSA